MAFPDYGPDGFLPVGQHEIAPKEFLDRFCNSGTRALFRSAMEDVLSFALARGATMVLVGGSFVSSKPEPSDLDCAIVFAREDQIPERADRIEISGTRLDIFFCAADQKGMVGSMVQLFSNSRNNRPVGVVAIPLQGVSGPELLGGFDLHDLEGLEIVQRAYTMRHITERNPGKKALITIHGIRSHGDWNAEVAHIASANGWIVAPYVYGYVEANVFFDSKKREEIIGGFRDHIDYISSRYKSDISIIAHSFGTFVVASYLWGFDVAPYPIDTLIMTGSVLDPNLKFDEVLASVAMVIHERAPNDKVVQLALPASFGKLKMLGRSGEIGFKNKAKNLEELTCDVFNHTNVIRRDVVSQRWMPRLEVNVGSAREAAMQRMFKRRPK